MRISVFGLGYVGAVSAACLAKEGHHVIGVDTNAVKVDLVNAGRSPIVEEGLGDLIAAAVTEGRLRATTSSREGLVNSELAFVCVGTPGRPNGSLDLTYLRRVSEQIGDGLREHSGFFVVVLRSTMLPGTTRDVIIPILEASSGKRAGVDFGVCVNPEFMREGSGVRDFYQPPKVVLGALDPMSRNLVTPIAAQGDAPVVQTNMELAEMTKYVDNTWHALKIAFANEIGTISKAHGIDGRRLMEIFCLDQKLNLSSAYLKPGFSFGGSCLPKDVRALAYDARRHDLELPLLNSILSSNQRQLERALQMILRAGAKKIGVLGLSFKPGTDDLRESPMVEIVERLLGKGYDIRIYDSRVNLAKLVGANRDYILNQIPHISDLMVPAIEEVLDHAQVLVVGNVDASFDSLLARVSEGQVVIDFARIEEPPKDGRAYDGICW